MNGCLFCKIIKGEIPAKRVYEDDDLVAFYDIHPQAPVHVLAVPRKHMESLKEVTGEDAKLMGKVMVDIADIARKLNISDSGYRVSVSNGKSAGQEIFHLHFHITGGWK